MIPPQQPEPTDKIIEVHESWMVDPRTPPIIDERIMVCGWWMNPFRTPPIHTGPEKRYVANDRAIQNRKRAIT